MEYSYNGKMWADVEVKGQPSKWVTLRALRVIKAVWRLRGIASGGYQHFNGLGTVGRSRTQGRRDSHI